jgi:hypothetical protein
MVNDEVTKVRVSGDGSTTTVPFSFKYLQDSDIKVYKINTAVTPEVATLKVLNTDYTITAGSPQGGTVTFTTAPTTDEDAFVKLDAPYTQTVDIPSAGVFREEAIENGLDKTVLLCQQLREEVGRGIQLPETSAITSVSFDTPVDGRALKWRDDGSGAWTAESSSYDPDDAGTYATAAEGYATSASSSATDAQAAQAAAEAAAASVVVPGLASQAEAEAGVENTKYMSSLRVAQAIDAQALSGYTPRNGLSADDTSIGSGNTLSALVKDGAWHDLDLSSIVPAGTKAVQISVRMRMPSGVTVGNQYKSYWRQNGATQFYESFFATTVYTQATLTDTADTYQVGIVALDTNRVLEYLIDNPAASIGCYLAVIGYFK